MVAVAAIGATSAEAQIIGAPALPEGSMRETGFATTQPEIRWLRYGIGTRWSVRAGVGSTGDDGSSLVLGLAHRR